MNMNADEFGETLLGVIEARLVKRGEIALIFGSLKALIREALHPGGYKAFERPPEPAQLPVPPEFPKLKVRYDRVTRRPVEHRIINDIRAEIPFMSAGWYTRPLAELEQVEQLEQLEGEGR